MRKIIVILLIIGGCYWGYHFLSARGGQGMPQMGAMPVSVAKVVERETSEWEEYSGRLAAVDRVEIRPRVQGTVDAIHFAESQMVKTGDPLFTIDPKPYEAALQSAQAQLVYSKAEWERAKKLLPASAISRHDYDAARDAYANAASAFTQAKLNLGYTQIKAPVSGRVSRAEITVGNLVNGGGDAPILTTIVSIDPVYAEFDVDEGDYVRYLHANGDSRKKLSNIPVELALSGDSDFKYHGHIKSFDNELNAKSGTVRARAQFENKSGMLIPGLYARLKVNGTGAHNVLLISERAITTDQDRKVVFLVGKDNKVEARAVKLGPVVDGLQVVREGLKSGDEVIVNGLNRARPGAAVVPQEVPMEDKGQGAPDAKG